MKNFFLTLDLEEWYHLEYIDKKSLSENMDISTINKLDYFFSKLDNYGIKITVFVLGELIQEYGELIKKISDNGHEIAIHGWDHALLNKKNNALFLKEISKTKDDLEELIGKEVVGYRSPCFSIDNEKLKILKDIGIKYDSSYIRFSDHPLYGNLSMSSFQKIDDLVYNKEGFFELELPTIKIFGKYIPISGGGYFRLFPKLLLILLFKVFMKRSHNFVMYLHPFELTDIKINTKEMSIRDRFRFQVGRKKNLSKLDWLIQFYIKNGYEFNTMLSYIRSTKFNQ